MMEMVASPTAYEDVNAILYLMNKSLQDILGAQMLGFYLYGSLALGDFDPASSDVDFLIVTSDDLSAEVLEQLRVMHAGLAASGLVYAQKIEGSYIPLRALRRYDPNDASHPSIGIDWPLHVGGHGSNWMLEREILREHGVIVLGPAPQTLIDPVSSADLRMAVCTQLRDFWSAQLDGPEWLRPRDYQAFATLTLCRALYTLHQGSLCSKPQAAAWAVEMYPQWRSVIERALLWRSLHEKDDLITTMTFLREALLQAQKLCPSVDVLI